MIVEHEQGIGREEHALMLAARERRAGPTSARCNAQLMVGACGELLAFD